MTRVNPENSQSSTDLASAGPGGSSRADECRYPRVSEVVKVLTEADRNGEGSYRNVLRKLRKNGDLKLICMKEGAEYRLCRPSDPEPPDADFVRCGGDKRAPEPEPSEETEQDVMTDGGTQVTAKQDLERIRQARDGDADDVRDETEPAETFTCPIEGCSRTVVGSAKHLRSHVRQAGDDTHRFRTLNEELELEFDEEAYHAAWGPGSQPSRPTEPIAKSAAETEW